MSQEHTTHFAILGAGPTGLEAALACAERGYPFTLYEGSDQVAGHVRSWGHVRLFTPWSMNASPRMRRALDAAGSPVPDGDECPTGDELVSKLFEPLANLPEIRDRLRCGSRVTAIGRRGLLKHDEIGTGGRAGRPFRLLMVDSDGHERVDSADIVLDCTGNTQPNSLGDGGIPAPGESHLAEHISREVPRLDSESLADASRFAGKTTLLVGGGHSAQTALRDLLALAEAHQQTRVVWVLRGDGPQSEDDDPLPERKALVEMAQSVARGAHSHVVDVRRHRLVDALAESDDGERVTVTLRSIDDDATETVEVDQILSLTGRVGDHLLYRQLQVHECYATSGPMKLAAALMASSGAAGDCLSQTSLGPESLRSPEPGFFILGSKSYGRRNDYLLQVGWQQVDEIFQLLD